MKHLFLLLATSLTLLADSPLQFEARQKGETIPTLDGFVRINSTIQSFQAGQPWQRNSPVRRRGLGVLLSPTEILTTAAMVADQTYLEFESADGTRTAPAKVAVIDYKANLALLAPKDTEQASFLEELAPIPLGQPCRLNDSVKVWQLESNGSTLDTVGTVRSINTSSTFLPGASFLTYVVKASMQSAASSFTLPVTRNRSLLGILTSYNSEDQICEVIAPEVIATFLTDARDGAYEGFPTLGIATQLTEDRSFRDYLNLPSEGGGLYISLVKEDSPAAKAGIEKGDVLLAIEGKKIDRRGYYNHPDYGPLVWTVLIRGDKTVGEEVTLTTMREGEKKEFTATLEAAEKPLIPTHIHDNPPGYLIKGGLVFQELSRDYLTAFGDNWTARAPLELMHVYENQDDYEEERNRVVFLSRVIPNPATVGYDQLASIIVDTANGKPVKDLKSLAEALNFPPLTGIHTIGLAETPKTLYLDARLADSVDQQLLQSGLPSLSRLPE